MTKQPEALILAGQLSHGSHQWGFSLPLIRSTVAELRRLHAENEALRVALTFYANGEHYNTDPDECFDTVSGEGLNWLFSGLDESTTLIENGSVAKHALESTAPQPAQQAFPDPVAEVESTVHGAGGFHCRLLADAMPPVGAKLYTSPPDTDALLNENRVLRESLERCKNIGSATASCWDDDKKEADALLRNVMESLTFLISTTQPMTGQQKECWPSLEKSLASIRKHLGVKA